MSHYTTKLSEILPDTLEVGIPFLKTDSRASLEDVNLKRNEILAGIKHVQVH